MSVLSIQNVAKQFSKQSDFAIENLSLKIEQKGSLTALVGESGSGKTTLLRMIAGLENPDSGEIHLGEKMLFNKKVNLAPHKRNIGLVFQDYALFPHLTVEKNIAFGLNHLEKKEQVDQISKYLNIVGLEAFRTRYPHELSGGQQQRVALARAMAPEPQLLLLDEPFSNLDGILKKSIRKEIKHIIEQTSITTIFVTHDTVDALSVADDIVVLKDGKILQQGNPEKIYNSPEDIYVAKLFGAVNIIPGAIEGKIINCALGRFEINSIPENISGECIVCVRPQHILLTNKPNETKAQITQISYFGGHHEMDLSINNDISIISSGTDTKGLKNDDTAYISIDSRHIILLQGTR